MDKDSVDDAMMTITAAAAVRRAIPARGATRRARGFDVCRGSAGESNNEAFGTFYIHKSQSQSWNQHVTRNSSK